MDKLHKENYPFTAAQGGNGIVM